MKLAAIGALAAVLTAAPRSRIRLVKISEARNRITDVERWLRAHRLTLPALQGSEIPANLPRAFNGHRLITGIRDGARLLLIYGRDFSGGRYLLGYDPAAGRYGFALDFAEYLTPPAAVPADREFVTEGLQWANQEDGLVYVALPPHVREELAREERVPDRDRSSPDPRALAEPAARRQRQELRHPPRRHDHRVRVHA